ncbi:protein IQ-DOMAIN 31 [Tanacetum coccineum]
MESLNSNSQERERELHQLQQMQDKEKESCMASFRLLHSLLKVLSNNDLKRTRIEGGFEQAFATLFNQDLQTFKATMLLNLDQLEKQLDKEEFQEIGSFNAFRVLMTQFQMFINLRFSVDDDDGSPKSAHVNLRGHKGISFLLVIFEPLTSTLEGWLSYRWAGGKVASAWRHATLEWHPTVTALNALRLWRWLPRAFGLVLSSTEFYSLRKLKKIDAKEVAVLPLNQNGNPNLSVSASQRSGGKIEDILLSDSSQDEVRTSVPDNQDVCTAATPVLDAQKDSDRIREEQAATDLQAALRGYLARREFRTLKGIIRLQALIRGHLVRRQAISTLYCMFQIVKIQALARGRKIRHSDIGVEVVMSSVGVVASSMQILTLSSNGFARKIISSSTTAIPLHFQYKANDMNSVLSWLKRWSASHCWKVLPKPKEGRRPDLKKSSTRRHSMPNVEIIASEFDKPIRNTRKVSSTETANIVEEENPELVLERIKRNLRKVNNHVSENTFQTEPETKKESTDNNTQNIATVLFEPEIPREDETVQEVGLMKKETKKPRRRGSLPVNQEYTENNEPPQTKRSLPSYMAATVSAKAKLRNQDFPETTTLNRRYSLPASINSKISLSPRVQTTGRLKNDRSLQLSRDGSGSGEHNTTVETGFVSGFLHCSV